MDSRATRPGHLAAHLFEYRRLIARSFVQCALAPGGLAKLFTLGRPRRTGWADGGLLRASRADFSRQHDGLVVWE
jgi:hypothetical protein